MSERLSFDAAVADLLTLCISTPERKTMRVFLVNLLLVAASTILLISCGEQAGNGNAANKPANATATAPAANAAEIETDLKKMTSDMAASLVKNDVAAMEKVYGENYMFVGPDGAVATRAQRLDAMKSGDTKYESIAYDEVSVRTNPDGTGAVVISRATVKGKNMGIAVDGQFRVTHVWSKTKDGWRMVNGQTTPIAAAARAKADDKATSTNTNANAGK
jgi:ketosteroid isomerase-like protein